METQLCYNTEYTPHVHFGGQRPSGPNIRRLRSPDGGSLGDQVDMRRQALRQSSLAEAGGLSAQLADHGNDADSESDGYEWRRPDWMTEHDIMAEADGQDQPEEDDVQDVEYE